MQTDREEVGSPQHSPRGGRPAKLTRRRILDVARGVPARELTLPVIARQLGVNPAALYYYFDSRDALLTALGELLMGELQTADADPARWREWLLRTTLELHRFFVANPVILAAQDWPRIARARFRLLENVLETLQGAGFSMREAVFIWGVVGYNAYADARVQFDASASPAGKRDPAAGSDMSQGAGDFPRVRALARKLENREIDYKFEEAVRWLIKVLPEPSRPKRPRPAKRRGRPM